MLCLNKDGESLWNGLFNLSEHPEEDWPGGKKERYLYLFNEDTKTEERKTQLKRNGQVKSSLVPTSKGEPDISF